MALAELYPLVNSLQLPTWLSQKSTAYGVVPLSKFPVFAPHKSSMRHPRIADELRIQC
jgi:hypothetical protein